MGVVYAIANQKGGVGKTTTAVNVAACVSAGGAQTLLVDLDPQCTATNAETRRRGGLGPVRERFAVTVLDCPPSLGPVSVNALVAADRVIVPVQAEYLALEGLVQFLDTLAMIRREMNPALDVSGLLITMHAERTRLAH